MSLPTYGFRDQIPRFYDLELESALILQKQEERIYLMNLLHGSLHRLSRRTRQISGVLQSGTFRCRI